MQAEVIRGVYIRGKAYPEGAIVELSKQEFLELKGWNYVREAPPPAAAPAEPPRRGEERARAKAA